RLCHGFAGELETPSRASVRLRWQAIEDRLADGTQRPRDAMQQRSSCQVLVVARGIANEREDPSLLARADMARQLVEPEDAQERGHRAEQPDQRDRAVVR